MTCLDPKYRIMLNEHEIVQSKLRVLEGFRDRNDYDISDTQSDIIGELILSRN